MDDSIAITLNENVKKGVVGIPDLITKSFYYGSSGDNRNLYRPLPLIVYALQIQMFGITPFFPHLLNSILFSITCIFIFLLLREHLFKESLTIPVIASFLFAAHPIHTEVVANIKSVDEILSLLGSLLALYHYLQFLNTNRNRNYFVSLFFFSMAVFSKENAITFLAVIPLTAYFFANKSLKKIAFTWLPYMSLGVIYLIIRYTLVDSHFEDLTISKNSLIGANSIYDRVATALYILGKYIKLLFFPYPLVWDYSYNQIEIVTFSDVKTLFSLVIYGLLLVLSVYYFKKKPRISWSILFYLITISIVSNVLILIGTSMGERLLYMPSLGICSFFPMITLHLLKYDYSKNHTF